ncbi:MAG: transposase, partial [Verrucomicrobiales bacterium]|nr:transposase [Verrucomicrobiales bacterium]
MKTYQINNSKKKAEYKGAPDNSPDLPYPVGIDFHSDIFDAVELLQGKKAKFAKVTRRFAEIPTGEVVAWAVANLDPDKNLLIIEATSNVFDAVAKLTDAGFSCVVIDSTQTEKVAETFIDNDQLAAERIARCYLTGYAKVVWVPDEKTVERRELFHAYTNAVTDHVRATNELKSFLTTKNIRPGKRNLNLEKNQQ